MSINYQFASTFFWRKKVGSEHYCTKLLHFEIFKCITLFLYLKSVLFDMITRFILLYA
jgi:hypothetical protein